MARITIDTTDAQYQRLLDGLTTLHDTLRPRLALLKQMDRGRQQWWLHRDPLLRQAIRFTRDLAAFLDEEQSA